MNADKPTLPTPTVDTKTRGSLVPRVIRKSAPRKGNAGTVQSSSFMPLNVCAHYS